MKPLPLTCAIALSHLLMAGAALADPITSQRLSAQVTPPQIPSTSTIAAGKLWFSDTSVGAISAAVTPPQVLSQMVEISPGIYAVDAPSDLVALVQLTDKIEGNIKAPKPSAQIDTLPSVHEALSLKEGSIIYDIHFEFDRATIIDKAVVSVQKIGQAMQADRDMRIAIFGFTDATGNYEHNRRLSQRRAEAIREAIMSQFGIAGSRFKAIGVGEDTPIASTDTYEGRAINRRVEVQV